MKKPHAKVVIILETKGVDEDDLSDMIDDMLDTGTIQETILEHAADTDACAKLKITSACVKYDDALAPASGPDWTHIDAQLKAGLVRGVPVGVDLEELIWQTRPESRSEIETRNPGRSFKPAAWAEKHRRPK